MRRIAITLLWLSVAWAGYAEMLSLIAWYGARGMSQVDPGLWVLPTPLADSSGTPLTGQRVERLGLSLQVPGGAIEDVSPVKNFCRIRFADGGTLIFFPLDVDAADTMRGLTPQEHQAMTEVLGTRVLRSNYDLMAEAMQATPAQVKWWSGRVENTRNMLLLMNKGMADHKAKVIHPIEFGTMRGFQAGDPSSAPFGTTLELFDRQDRHYLMSFSVPKGRDHPLFTQAEINAMVASMHPLPR